MSYILSYMSYILLKDVIDTDNSSFLSSLDTVTYDDAGVQFYTPPPPG